MFLFYILAVFVGLAPFLIYNYSLLGNVTELILKYNDRQIYTQVSEEIFTRYGFLDINLSIVYQILLGHYRGLFIYYPIFLFSFYGLYLMYKQNYKRETLLILFILISFIIFTASRITWHGGYTFGLRFLLPTMPFLTIPVIFVIKNIRSPLRSSFFILVFLSFFTNLLSLNIWEDSILDRSNLLISKKLQQKVDNYQDFLNPSTQHYGPLSIKHGPRSLIFENLWEGHLDVDIRGVPFSRGWEFPYVSKNHMAFLSLFPLILIIFLGNYKISAPNI